MGEGASGRGRDLPAGVERHLKRMRITSHKELHVWQEAMNAAMEIFKLTKSFPNDEKYSLVDQIRSSSRSVAANIAEAWRRRRYEAAFVAKLNDADGEAAETQTSIDISCRCQYISSATAIALDDRYEKIMSQLVKMIAAPEAWIIKLPPRKR